MSKIVGHKTMHDGTHLPLYEDEAKEMMTKIREREEKRRALMPTEQDAINMMFEAHQRLRELGWCDPIYCPKDGSQFDVIEAGSTGIHKAHYSGEWPTGSWWVAADGDLWPSRPVMYRRTEAEKERWKKAAEGLKGIIENGFPQPPEQDKNHDH